MLGRKKPIGVPKGDPFRNDKLQRGKHITRLTDTILVHAQAPFVMTLASPWGSGKTTFISMWKQYLEDKGHTCILYDAWKHDFSHEPLLSLIGEIGDTISTIQDPSIKAQCTNILVKFGDNIAELLGLCGDLLKLGDPISLWASPTATLLKGGKIAVQAATKYVKSGHSTLKKSLEDFKGRLTELVGLMSMGGKRPVYFFIDELDRCEPTYAIKLLEAIKHLFDIDGIVFILSIDKDQLSSMASTRYGAHFDANGYLRRFIDLEYTIPEPELKDYITHLIQDIYAIENIPSDAGYIDSITTALANMCTETSIHARTIERALCRASIALKMERTRFDECPQILSTPDSTIPDTIDKDSITFKKYTLWHELIIACAIIREENAKLYEDIITNGFPTDIRNRKPSFLYSLSKTTIGRVLTILTTNESRIEQSNTANASMHAALLLNQNQKNKDKRVLQEISDRLNLTADISFRVTVRPKGIESAAQVGTPTATYR